MLFHQSATFTSAASPQVSPNPKKTTPASQLRIEEDGVVGLGATIQAANHDAKQNLLSLLGFEALPALEALLSSKRCLKWWPNENHQKMQAAKECFFDILVVYVVVSFCNDVLSWPHQLYLVLLHNKKLIQLIESSKKAQCIRETSCGSSSQYSFGKGDSSCETKSSDEEQSVWKSISLWQRDMFATCSAFPDFRGISTADSLWARAHGCKAVRLEREAFLQIMIKQLHNVNAKQVVRLPQWDYDGSGSPCVHQEVNKSVTFWALVSPNIRPRKDPACNMSLAACNSTASNRWTKCSTFNLGWPSNLVKTTDGLHRLIFYSYLAYHSRKTN